jgi:hypothetical protein
MKCAAQDESCLARLGRGPAGWRTSRRWCTSRELIEFGSGAVNVVMAASAAQQPGRRGRAATRSASPASSTGSAGRGVPAVLLNQRAEPRSI